MWIKIKNHSCVKGFTLLEAVIAMMLSSLLVLFALAAIRYYSQLFFNVQNRDEMQSTILMLQNVLNEDVRQCEKIEFAGELVFVRYDEQVRYQFEDKGIVRFQGVVSDTFKVQYNSPQIEISKKIPGLVERVTLECVNEEVIFPVNVVKEYPMGLKTESNF